MGLCFTCNGGFRRARQTIGDEIMANFMYIALGKNRYIDVSSDFVDTRFCWSLDDPIYYQKLKICNEKGEIIIYIKLNSILNIQLDCDDREEEEAVF